MKDWIVPDWPAPASVAALCTTRLGGVSRGPWHSLNLGTNGGDDPAAVAQNRRILGGYLPAKPRWLRQVHGTTVIRNAGDHSLTEASVTEPDGDDPEDSQESARPDALPAVADAQWSDVNSAVCVVMTADCLPVLFCDRQGTRVAAAHAGWRGLAAGVLENTVAALGTPPGELLAWLGPAIGPEVYQVGGEVRAAFLAAEGECGPAPAGSPTAARASRLDDMAQQPAAAAAFKPDGDRWLFDLYAMARHRLQRAGVGHISGGDFCTFTDSKRFFSYRRDNVTGRMASLVWLQQ